MKKRKGNIISLTYIEWLKIVLPFILFKIRLVIVEEFGKKKKLKIRTALLYVIFLKIQLLKFIYVYLGTT